MELVESGTNVPTARKIERQESIRRDAEDQKGTPGVLSELSDAETSYRTIYVDPPWQYRDEGASAAATPH